MERVRNSVLIVVVALAQGACFTPNVDARSSEGTSTGAGDRPGGDTTRGSPPAEPSDSTGSASDSSGASAAGTVGGESGSSGSDSGNASCGNARVDAGEDCDDGNYEVGDGCNPDCRVSGAVLWTATVHEGEERASSLSIGTDDAVTVVGLVGAPGDAQFSNWWREYSVDGDVLATGATPVDLIDVAEAGGTEGVRYWATFVGGDGDDFGGWPVRVGGFDATWAEVWSAPLDVGLFGDVFVGHTAVDEAGRVLVGGASTEGPSFTYTHRGFTARFDASGTQTDLEQNPTGDGLYASACSGLASSGSGRHATLCYADRNGPFVLRRYSADGVLELSNEIDADAAYLANQVAIAELGFVAPAIAVNDAGDVVVAIPVGEGPGTTPLEMLLHVVGTGGSTTWTGTQTGSGSLLVHDVALFADGSLVVVGEDESEDGAGGQDLTIARYDAAGAPLWSSSDGAGEGEDRFRDVELDSEENILVLGSTESARTGTDLFIRKYAP